MTEISVRCGSGSSLAKEKENWKRSALDFLCMTEKKYQKYVNLNEVIKMNKQIAGDDQKEVTSLCSIRYSSYLFCLVN